MTAEYKARVIKKAAHYFVAGDDGFFVYWPTQAVQGAYTAHDLRIIADELDARNKDWQESINEYFATRAES